jgi:hypothetical protein
MRLNQLLPKAKSPAGKRKNFVRTQIPRSENLISVFLLILMAGIGIAISIKGKHFDPDLYSVNVASLKSTSEAVEGKTQTVSASTEMDPSGGKSPISAQAVPQAAASPDHPEVTPANNQTTGDPEGGAESGTNPAPAPKGDPMEITLEGIKPMSPTEFYNADTLYEKIDGRSPAYQNFHVLTLRCRTFSVIAEPGSFVDVYEYSFDSPVDAFGMYSLERDPKGKPLDFIPDGYSGEMGWFFRRGVVYVQIIASDEKPKTIALAESLARNRAKVLPENDAGLAGKRSLPSVGLVADSISFVPENAQGQAALKDVFQAKYKVDGGQLSFFIMATKPEEALKAWKSFQDFCARFGKVTILADSNGAKVFSAQLFGNSKIVYVRGGEVGGVYDAADPLKAKAFIERYLKGELK